MATDTTPIVTEEVDENDEELREDCCSTNIVCDPRRRVHRYFVLIIMCFLSFGSYFCYDNPAAMQDIMIKELNISSTQYMSFYSWYSWPQVVLSFMGGFLIDRVFGIRLGAIVFASFTTVGQLIFALGSYINVLWVMDAARFIFGIGGESLAVAQNTYAASWFQADELNMVFGLQLSMSRIGSTVNMNSMQPIYNSMSPSLHGYQRLGLALFIASVTCVFSLCLTFLMAYLDKRAHNFTKDMNPVEETPPVSFKDIRHFPLSYWLISIICVAYYVTIFPYVSLGLVFYERKYGLSPTYADGVNSVTYILSAAISPISGFIIDMTGKNIFWIILGIILTALCHAGAAFTFFIPPLVIAIVMGIGYSILASALWPMVAIIIPRHMLGTAYGIMQAVQNFGLAVIALVAGILVDSKGYLILEVFFLMWLCVSLIAAALLYLYDATVGNGALNRSSKERKAEKKKKDEEQQQQQRDGEKEVDYDDRTPIAT